MTTYHIYKIKSQQTNKIYIGSTLKELTERLKHPEYNIPSCCQYINWCSASAGATANVIPIWVPKRIG